jgi:hypothetical protein
MGQSPGEENHDRKGAEWLAALSGMWHRAGRDFRTATVREWDGMAGGFLTVVVPNPGRAPFVGTATVREWNGMAGGVAVHTPNNLYRDFVLLYMSQQLPIPEPLWNTIPADAQAALLAAWKEMEGSDR